MKSDQKDPFFEYSNNIDMQHDMLLYDYEVLNLLALHLSIYNSDKPILEESASKRILGILLQLRNRKELKPNKYEDVHSLVQSLVTEQDDSSGSNLRIFLSRNDQSQTDIRMYLRDNLLSISKTLLSISQVFDNIDLIGQMPGFTHYRQAMPLAISTYFSSWSEAMLDQVSAILGVVESFDVSPLGSGSGYGSYLQVDYEKCAKYLGFSQSSENPIYIANKRGFDELAAIESLTSTHLTLSRLVMDLIFLSDNQYGIIKLPSGFVTGSSLMPNKKNPDFLELYQGYTATAVGSLSSCLSILLNKTSGYHRDFQICKQNAIDLVSYSRKILESFLNLVSTMEIDSEKANASLDNSSFATLRAMELFEQGIPWFESYRKASSEAAQGMQFKNYTIKANRNDLTEKRDRLEKCVKKKADFISDSTKRLIAECKSVIDGGVP